MMFSMEVSIIKIGNSKGIRLSETLLEMYNITDKIELILEKGQIILRPISEPRKGWDKAFQKMHENGDDQLLMNDVFEDENSDDWK
jgi:antitoxin MazE